jgi:hypothetical protein
MRVQGYGGQVKAGGRPVADVLTWEITDSGAEYAVSAQLGPTDSIYLELLSAFDVELDLGKKALTWKRQPLTVEGDHITFRTGRMQSVEK